MKVRVENRGRGLFAIRATQCKVTNVAPHTHRSPHHTDRLSHRVAAIFHVLSQIFWFNPSQRRSAISQFHSLSLSGAFSQPFCHSKVFILLFWWGLKNSKWGTTLRVKTFLFLAFLCTQHWGCIAGLDPLWEKTVSTRGVWVHSRAHLDYWQLDVRSNNGPKIWFTCCRYHVNSTSM